jgi:hypothetical protein
MKWKLETPNRDDEKAQVKGNKREKRTEGIEDRKKTRPEIGG